MARISYTERSEWKSRIEKRFQNAIDNVKADNSLDWDNFNKIAEQRHMIRLVLRSKCSR